MTKTKETHDFQGILKMCKQIDKEHAKEPKIKQDTIAQKGKQGRIHFKEHGLSMEDLTRIVFTTQGS